VKPCRSSTSSSTLRGLPETSAAMPMDDDRLAYLLRLMGARVPEIDAADLALLAETASPEAISSEVMNALLDVIDALEMKLAALEQGLAARPDPARFTH
jgi:hypothetical protein